MHHLTDWEQKEIERLSRSEPDKPKFVTREKQRMIKLIKEGKGCEIMYDEWGEVYYPVTRDAYD